jgi:hypothetical protein
VGHEDPAFEGSFGEDEGEGGDVVEMETDRTSSAFLYFQTWSKNKWRDEIVKQLGQERIIESKHRDGGVVNRFVLIVCSKVQFD